MTDGIDSTTIQPRAEAPEDLHITNGSIGAHDDFEDDVPFDALTSGVFGVIGPNFTEHLRRGDAAARAIRSAAGASAGPGADA